MGCRSTVSKVERSNCALVASVKQIEAEQSIILKASTQTAEQAGKINATISDLVTMFGVFSSTAIQLIQQILFTNHQIYTVFSDLQASILRQPSISLGDSFRFTDALGRGEDLPYAYFQYWEVFDAYLKTRFRDMPGERRVKDGHYHLLDVKAEEQSQNSIVGRHKWKCAIFPGARIGMSMIISANFTVEQPPLRQVSEESFAFNKLRLLGDAVGDFRSFILIKRKLSLICMRGYSSEKKLQLNKKQISRST